MAIEAMNKNRNEDRLYTCEHICIGPYEMPWLEEVVARVIRKPVESVEQNIFHELEENDLLFIDSSHIIRPQGDVLYEYLEILPLLRPCVIVHIHDIFTPKDYPDDWLRENIKFWNEQYLLETCMSFNSEWEIIGALNYLKHHYYDKLIEKYPMLTVDREPGSFYIRRRRDTHA